MTTERKNLIELWASDPQLALTLVDSVPDFEPSDFSFDVFPLNNKQLRKRLISKSGKYLLSIVKGYATYSSNGSVELAILTANDGDWATCTPELETVLKSLNLHTGCEYDIYSYLPYETCIKLLLSI